MHVTNNLDHILRLPDTGPKVGITLDVNITDLFFCLSVVVFIPVVHNRAAAGVISKLSCQQIIFSTYVLLNRFHVCCYHTLRIDTISCNISLSIDLH